MPGEASCTRQEENQEVRRSDRQISGKAHRRTDRHADSHILAVSLIDFKSSMQQAFLDKLQFNFCALVTASKLLIERSRNLRQPIVFRFRTKVWYQNFSHDSYTSTLLLESSSFSCIQQFYTSFFKAYFHKTTITAWE
jgi:hypothetical protein